MCSQRIIQFWIEEFRVDGKLTALSQHADLDALFASIPDFKTIAANRKSYWRKVFRQRAAAHIFGMGRPEEAVAWPSDDTPNAARTLAGKFRLGANDIVGYASQYQNLVATLGQTEAVRAGWLFRQLIAHYPPTVVAPYDFSIYAQAIIGLGGIKRMITPAFLASFGRKLSQCATAQEALDWVNLEEQVGGPGHINREAFERYRQWGIENFAMLAHLRSWINADWPRAAPTFNPAWCDMPVRWAAQLYEGHSPAAVTGGDLTRVELRRWIASGTDKDARWWVAERIWRMYGLGDEPYWLHNRSREVAIWLVGKWGNAAMTKPRRVPEHVRRWAKSVVSRPGGLHRIRRPHEWTRHSARCGLHQRFCSFATSG
ncbi:MAG: hypothetical protein HC853_01200 [Anaerolineae bacterium]|nr:hypothetical protein [Anaerolineae bacterium]